MKKRFLSLLLAFAMVVSLFAGMGITASAEGIIESLESWVSFDEANGTVTVTPANGVGNYCLAYSHEGSERDFSVFANFNGLAGDALETAGMHEYFPNITDIVQGEKSFNLANCGGSLTLAIGTVDGTGMFLTGVYMATYPAEAETYVVEKVSYVKENYGLSVNLPDPADGYSWKYLEFNDEETADLLEAIEELSVGAWYDNFEIGSPARSLENKFVDGIDDYAVEYNTFFFFEMDHNKFVKSIKYLEYNRESVSKISLDVEVAKPADFVLGKALPDIDSVINVDMETEHTTVSDVEWMYLSEGYYGDTWVEYDDSVVIDTDTRFGVKVTVAGTVEDDTYYYFPGDVTYTPKPAWNNEWLDDINYSLDVVYEVGTYSEITGKIVEYKDIEIVKYGTYVGFSKAPEGIADFMYYFTDAENGEALYNAMIKGEYGQIFAPVGSERMYQSTAPFGYEKYDCLLVMDVAENPDAEDYEDYSDVYFVRGAAYFVLRESVDTVEVDVDSVTNPGFYIDEYYYDTDADDYLNIELDASPDSVTADTNYWVYRTKEGTEWTRIESNDHVFSDEYVYGIEIILDLDENRDQDPEVERYFGKRENTVVVPSAGTVKKVTYDADYEYLYVIVDLGIVPEAEPFVDTVEVNITIPDLTVPAGGASPSLEGVVASSTTTAAQFAEGFVGWAVKVTEEAGFSSQDVAMYEEDCGGWAFVNWFDGYEADPDHTYAVVVGFEKLQDGLGFGPDGEYQGVVTGDQPDFAYSYGNFMYLYYIVEPTITESPEPEEPTYSGPIQNLNNNENWNITPNGNTVTIAAPEDAYYFVDVLPEEIYGDDFEDIMESVLGYTNETIAEEVEDLVGSQNAGFFTDTPYTGDTTIPIEESSLILVFQVNPSIMIPDYDYDEYNEVMYDLYALVGVGAKEVVVSTQVTNVKVLVDEDELPEFTAGDKLKDIMSDELLTQVYFNSADTANNDFMAVVFPAVKTTEDNIASVYAPAFAKLGLNENSGYDEILAAIDAYVERMMVADGAPSPVSVNLDFSWASFYTGDLINGEYALKEDDTLGLVVMLYPFGGNYTFAEDCTFAVNTGTGKTSAYEIVMGDMHNKFFYHELGVVGSEGSDTVIDTVDVAFDWTDVDPTDPTDAVTLSPAHFKTYEVSWCHFVAGKGLMTLNYEEISGLSADTMIYALVSGQPEDGYTFASADDMEYTCEEYTIVDAILDAPTILMAFQIGKASEVLALFGDEPVEDEPYVIGLDVDDLKNAEAGVFFYDQGVYGNVSAKETLFDASETVELKDNSDSAVVVVYADYGYAFVEAPVVTVNGGNAITAEYDEFEDSYIFKIYGFSGDSTIKVTGAAVAAGGGDEPSGNTVNNINVTIDWDKIVYNVEGYPELHPDNVILTPDVVGAIDLEHAYFDWVYYDEAEGGEWYTLDFGDLPAGDTLVGIQIYSYPTEGYEFGSNPTVSCGDYEVVTEFETDEAVMIIKLGDMSTALSGIKPYTPPTLAAVDIELPQEYTFDAIVNGETLPDLDNLVDMGILSGKFTSEGGDQGDLDYTRAQWMYAPIGSNDIQAAEYDHVANTDENVYYIKITAATWEFDFMVPASFAQGSGINIKNEEGKAYAKSSFEFVYFEESEDDLKNGLIVVVTPAGDEPPAPPVDTGDYIPPTTDIPMSNGDNKMDVEADISGNDVNLKPLDDEQINQLVGKDNANGDVVIDLSDLGRNIDTAGIPKKTLESIVEAAEDAGNKTEHLVIKLSTATLTIDDAAMRAIVDQADGDVVKFNFDDVGLGRLNAEQKEAVKDLDIRKGYEAYITVNGQRVSDFRGGNVEIIVPYAVPAGENVAGFSVWYIDDDGKVEKQKSTYDGKNKWFVVSHFSDYVIAYSKDDADVSKCEKGETCPLHFFSDVNKQAWYHDGVHYCIAAGLMNGISENQFAPNMTTSRAMVVTMLWRMEGSPLVECAEGFNDVYDGDWYNDAIRWATEADIVEGYEGYFNPNNSITREQMATILWRYCKYKGIDVSVGEETNILSYEDAFHVSDWAMEAMQWACGAGVIQGIEKNGTMYLDPQGSAVRSQSATMLYRFCEEVK